MNFRRTKYIWLPALLLVYIIVMAYIGRDTLIVQGDWLRYFGSIAAELAVIVALAVFLRKKQKLQDRRENRNDNPNKMK